MDKKQIEIIRRFLLPRIKAMKWSDIKDDPMSRIEGKFFNLGIEASAKELEKIIDDLEFLVNGEE
jgi:hypothetical protein